MTMKKKLYTRPVSVTLSEEMFDQIKTFTDSIDISISDYIRLAIKRSLDIEQKNTRHNNNHQEGEK
jgi:hypothetical protein